MKTDSYPESKSSPNTPPPKAVVSLTPSAKEYLSSVIPENTPGDYVSLGVKGGGCSGMQYVWDFASNWPDVNWSEPIDNVLVLDPMAEMYVIGCTVDYIKELFGSYLKISNPNEKASCGCGESFGV